MDPLTQLQSKIDAYRRSHTGGYVQSDEAIISILLQNGEISADLVQKAKKESVFAYGFNADNTMGLRLERTTSNQNKPQAKSSFGTIEEMYLQKTIPQTPVSDATNRYNVRAALHADEPEWEEKEMTEGELELALFYYFNSDQVNQVMSNPVSYINTNSKKFKDLEEAAEYLLKKFNKPVTEGTVGALARELIMLNSNHEATTLDDKVNSALENINKGNIKYSDENKYLKQKNEIKSLNLPPEEAQLLESYTNFIMDNAETANKIKTEIDKVFEDYKNKNIKQIKDVSIKIFEILDKYKDSVVAQQLSETFNKLQSISTRYPEETWKEVLTEGCMSSIRTANGLKLTLDDFTKPDGNNMLQVRNVDTDYLKSVLLTRFGINLYSEKDADKVKQMQPQVFIANIMGTFFSSVAGMYENNYEHNSFMYHLCHKIVEGIESISPSAGDALWNDKEKIEDFNKSADYWNNFNPALYNDKDFKLMFKNYFGRDFDETAAEELFEYCASNPSLDMFEDKEFQKKFETLFGIDIKSLKRNMNIKNYTAMVGEIAFMLLTMGKIGSSSAIQGLGKGSYAMYSKIGLSGKALQTFTAMTVGSAQFAAFNGVETLVDNAVMGNNLTDNLLNNMGKGAAFGAFASALNVLAIQPMVSEKIAQAGADAAKSMLESGQEISGSEILKTYYVKQEPIIKSALGKFGYTLGVNTAGFTAYNVASDLITNGIEPLYNGNAGKYLGTVALENLKSLLTFEAVQIITGMMVSGETGGNTARQLSIEESIEMFDSLKNVSVRYNPNGMDEYIIRTSNGASYNASSIESVIGLLNVLAVYEMQLKNNYAQGQQDKPLDVTRQLAMPEVRNELNSLDAALEKIKTEEYVSVDELQMALKTIVSGDCYLEKISYMFRPIPSDTPDGSPKQSVKILDLIKLIQEYTGESESKKIYYILCIINKNSNKPYMIPEPQINGLIDYINYLKEHNIASSQSPEESLQIALRCAIDENGTFSTKYIMPLLERGMSIDEINAIGIKYQIDIANSNIGAYNLRLKFEQSEFPSPEIKTFIESYIFKRNAYENFDDVKERYDIFEKHKEQHIAFIKDLLEKYPIMAKNGEYVNLAKDDIQIEMYSLMPDYPSRENVCEFLASLENVNEKNAGVFKAIFDYAKKKGLT